MKQWQQLNTAIIISIVVVVILFCKHIDRKMIRIRDNKFTTAQIYAIVKIAAK